MLFKQQHQRAQQKDGLELLLNATIMMAAGKEIYIGVVRHRNSYHHCVAVKNFPGTQQRLRRRGCR